MSSFSDIHCRFTSFSIHLNSKAAFLIVADGTSKPINMSGAAQDLFMMIYHRLLTGFGKLVL